jgi:hypothetical protein
MYLNKVKNHGNRLIARIVVKLSGGYYEKVTPVPIPNTAVKLLSVDDTWTVASRESRSLPDLYQSPLLNMQRALFCLLHNYISCIEVIKYVAH